MSKLPYLPRYQDSLGIFVGELRDLLFSSQEETAAHFHLDRSRISRYETSHSTPKIGYVVGLAQLLAKRAENEPEVQHLLLQEVNRVVDRHYRRSRFGNWETLCQTAEAYRTDQQAKSAAKNRSKSALDDQAIETWETELEKRLDLPPSGTLVGVTDHLNRLSEVVFSPDAPWLVCINGLGGIGKTALANVLVRQPDIPDRFRDVAWVSAKQQHFLPGTGIEEVSSPALNANALIDTLLEQLASNVLLGQPPSQKKAVLTELLKKAPYLIVIDNLETVADYRALVPTLLKLAKPSKFLLTSRHSLQVQPNVFCLCLEELDLTDTIRLIRQEGEIRGITDLFNASDIHLQSIYEVVGGNPLALQLVVGQTSVLSLSQVLDNLKEAQEKSIDELYTFIYWQAWHMLDTNSQEVLLMMPLAPNGTLEQLVAVTELATHEVNQALQHLARLSLVQVGGSLEQRRYTVHRLTETFLLNEAIQWKTSI